MALKTLYFRDLMTAVLMLSYEKQHGHLPRQVDLFNRKARLLENDKETNIKAGLINFTLAEKGIPKLYTHYITGTQQLDDVIRRLRAAEILEPSDPEFRRASYKFYREPRAELVRRFLKKFNISEWRTWPLNMEIRTPSDGENAYKIGMAHYNAR